MAKNKPPYFSFYPKDFSADSVVEIMSTMGVGCYILLLCKAWHEEPAGSLPPNDCTLARWSRVGTDDWAAVRTEVLAAFTLGDDGRYHQQRMRREFDAFREKSNKASESAKKRWGRNANALPTHCESNARASGSGSNSGSCISSGGSAEGGGAPAEKPPGKSAPWESVPIPDALDTPTFASAWKDWHAYRRERKLCVWTLRTCKIKLDELAKGSVDDAINAITNSIGNGYQGIFPVGGICAKKQGSARAKKAEREYTSELAEAARL